MKKRTNKDQSEQADLKRREYRDARGGIHHHTHPYMEQHRGERSRANEMTRSERSGRSTKGSGPARFRSKARSAHSRPTQSRSQSSRSSESRSPQFRAAESRSRSSQTRAPRTRSAQSRGGHAAHALIDHGDIRRWAERRGGQPACVKGTGRRGDVGMIRLDFPGYSGAGSLQKISWNDWFRSFDDNNLALLVQDSTARGQESHFNKLVSRTRVTGGQQASRRRAS